MKKRVWVFLFLILVPSLSAVWEQFQSDEFNTGKTKGTGYFDGRTAIKLINDIVAVDKFNQLKGFKQIGFAVNYDNIAVESFDKKVSLSGKKLKNRFKAQNIESDIEIESVYEEIDTSFFNVDRRPVKQTYILRNLLNTGKNVKLNILYEIDSDFVVWNGTRHTISNEPIYFKAFEVTEEIFPDLNETSLTGHTISFGNNYFDFKDITDLDYTVSVYSLDGKDYINLEISQEIEGLGEFIIDPVIGWTTHVITTSADAASSVYAIDIDNDKDIDVLSASFTDSKVTWYENDGSSPPNWTTHNITISATGAASVFAIDIDNDKDIDVVSALETGDRIEWYENDGSSPPIWIAHNITTSVDAPEEIYAIDIDNDNDIDIVSALYKDDKIVWYENDGSSPPNWTSHVITTYTNGAFSVFAIDIDNDNDVDVLSASNYDDKIEWYENDGSSPPGWSTHIITNSLDGGVSVYAIDIDNDNDVDVVGASHWDGKIEWYENDGSSPPTWTTHVITTSVNRPYTVYAIDIDNDNDVDVLSASLFDDKIAWYENDGSSPPTWTTHVITTSDDGARDVYAIDIDNDNDVDVLSASNWVDEIAWYESDLTTPNICNGRVQVQSLNSNDNPIGSTNVFVDGVYKGTTDDFGLFESQETSICGESLSYTLKCLNNSVSCETKTITLDVEDDFKGLSFDCSVCTGDIDLRADISNIKTNKGDNKITANLTLINVPTTSNVNITFKVQGSDGLISREESQLFNVGPNERFKFIAQSISLTGNDDFVHVYVDPNNKVLETNEKNNYALVPLFEPEIDAYLDISTGYSLIDREIKDYLKLFVNEKSQNQADVTIAVGLPNKNSIINSKNSLTKKNYKWWFDNRAYYNNKPLGSMPYNGLVGAFSDDYNYVFVVGNDIDGLIAAIKRLISARELFFNNLNKDKVSVIEDTDVAGISVADLLRNPSNWPYYDKRGTIMFANVVSRILNNNNFEIDIRTVKTYNDNTTLRLKNINSDFSDDFKDAVVGNTKPVVLARGLWSNLFTWEDFGKELAFDENNARDTWLIEITGGPTTECETCPNYEYEDLTDYYWPALIAGVEEYSGQNTIDYVGFSNGCRVGLDSLKNWSNGKDNAGYCFNRETGKYDINCDLAANSVDTFVGVGCPGAFNGSSLFVECFGQHGEVILNYFEENNIDHPAQIELGQRLAHEAGNIRCGIILRVALNDDGRISRNLGQYYLNLVQSDQDSQLGESLSLNRFALIYGNNGYQFNNDNDYIVPVADEIAIFDNIASSDKRNYQRFYRHNELPEAEDIQEIIINELR